MPEDTTTAPATPSLPVVKGPAPVPPNDAPTVPVSAPSELSPDEERQLGDLLDRRDRAAASGDVVELKVEPPHSEMVSPSGHRIGSDWTTVPARAESRIMSAAADAGVTITRKG
jgi:hypothetical protein